MRLTKKDERPLLAKIFYPQSAQGKLCSTLRRVKTLGSINSKQWATIHKRHPISVTYIASNETHFNQEIQQQNSFEINPYEPVASNRHYNTTNSTIIVQLSPDVSIMFLILYFLLVYSLHALSTPNPQRLPTSEFVCVIDLPHPSSPVNCAKLIDRVLEERWARETRVYSRLEPKFSDTHLPHVSRYNRCQLTIALVPGQEYFVTTMRLAEHKDLMERMISKCIVDGFSGAEADVGLYHSIKLTISGEFNPLMGNGVGNGTAINNTIW